MYDFTIARPRKQGAKFFIDLGQNQDAYPEKDRMLSTRRGSSKLIRVTEGPKSVRSGSMSVMKQRREDSNEPRLPEISADARVRAQTEAYTEADENFHTPIIGGAKYSAQEETFRQGRELKDKMRGLKADAANLRREMEQMYETLHHFGKEERSEYLGIIKEFGKMVKKKLEDSREKKDGLVREFDQILRDRGIAKKKLKLIENRVKYLEQYCGIDPKDAQQHTTQETLEF